MRRALGNLGAAAWISGLRQRKAKSRQNLDVLLWRNGRGKVHPLIDWTGRDVFRYLTRHNLPYHPLWEQGYASIGDVHTTRRLSDGTSEEATRFFGLKRGCGLHEHVLSALFAAVGTDLGSGQGVSRSGEVGIRTLDC